MKTTFRHNIPVTWRGKAFMLKLHPEPSHNCAIVDPEQAVIWCHPDVWAHLSSIDDAILLWKEKTDRSEAKGGAA